MQSIDSTHAVWMLIAALFVFLMQGGFLLLEAGRTRSRNSISVAQKNISDLLVTWSTFATVGFALAYGPAWLELSIVGNLFGNPTWHWDTQQFGVHFLYQVGFAAAAATIVSGAVAERMRFWIYCALTAVLVVLIYPLVARAAWGDALGQNNDAWLANFGFIDAAGSTVVHALGGWAALAACLLLGRRVDIPRGSEAQGHSDVLSLLGALFLIIGWLGFNAGSAAPGSPEFASAIVNTVVATAVGGCVGLGLGAWLDSGIARPGRSINGVLGGLVAITASATFAEREAAMVVGALGGATAVVVADLLRENGLDDPLDAIATHGFAGLFGTLAVAFVAPLDMLKNGSIADQLTAQFAGSLTVFVIAFFGTWTVLTGLSRFTPLRMREQGERIGLNISEHGATLGTDRLQSVLTAHVEGGPTRGPVREKLLPSTEGDDTSNLAETIDKLVDQYDSARAAAEKSSERLEDFASAASDFLWEADTTHRITFLSQRFAAMYGCDPQSFIGRPLRAAFGVDEANWASLQEQVRRSGRFDHVVGHLSNTQEKAFSLRLRGRQHRDAAGVVAGLRGAANDITEKQRYETELSRLAYQDDLTGLLNRRSLRQKLDQLATASGASFAVVLFDLDGFKAVNDTFGHGAGDGLLLEVAERLSSCCGEDQHAARMGGDEFVALLDGLSGPSAAEQALQWARAAVKRIQQPIELDGSTICVGVSAGICVANSGDIQTDRLLQNADRALYHVKRQGGTTALLFDPALDADEDERRRIEQAMAVGLSSEEFFVEYQPQFTSGGRLIGCEALLRWRRASGEMVPPATFIPIAEQSTLIHRLGSFVLSQACKDAVEWGMRDPRQLSVPVSVNVSVVQLKMEDFVGVVQEALRASGLPANRLQLEITESVLASQPEAIIRKLEALRRLGVTVALDDFGTGFSSLNYLKALPIDRLKIDRSFVQDLNANQLEEAIVDTIISLGNTLSLDVIAEGVEHEEQLEALSRLGCSNYQGYYFSRPIPKADLVRNFGTAALRRTGRSDQEAV